MKNDISKVIAILAGADEPENAAMLADAQRLHPHIIALGDVLFDAVKERGLQQKSVKDAIFVGATAIAISLTELIGFARRSVGEGEDGDTVARLCASMFLITLDQNEPDLLQERSDA